MKDEHKTYCGPVGGLDVEHEVLHEVHLVACEHYRKARGGHLRQRQDEQGHRVQLQMAPVVVAHNCRVVRRTARKRLQCIYGVRVHKRHSQHVIMKPTRKLEQM